MFKVMVVEDEGIIALVLKSRLEKMGFEVPEPISSGQEAINRFPAMMPDIVMMDVTLGKGMDGISTAAQLKRERDVPIIFLSAYSDDATLARAAEIAPVRYLKKPFADGELQEALQEAVSRLES